LFVESHWLDAREDEVGTSDKRKRRDFLKKAAYAAPAILSLQAVSAVAKAGSIKDPEEAKKEKEAKEKEKEFKKKDKEAKKNEKQAKQQDKEARKQEKVAKQQQKEAAIQAAKERKTKS
jgi:outer membrane biosynthesis protein TonB